MQKKMEEPRTEGCITIPFKIYFPESPSSDFCLHFFRKKKKKKKRRKKKKVEGRRRTRRRRRMNRIQEGTAESLPLGV